MNARDVVEHLFRYLRREQRELPMMNPDLDDPLPEALVAMNATLQSLAVRAPKFAAQRPMGALFHAPLNVAVTGLVREGMEVLCEGWPEWAVGCELMIPGDERPNRLLEIEGTVGRLVFPYLGDAAGGNARLAADCVTLGAEVITVLPPVRLRGGRVLRPVNGRRGLMAGGVERGDYGRMRRVREGPGDEMVYSADSVMSAGAGLPRVQLRLGRAVEAELMVEFDARCSLGWLTADDVYGCAPLPVPAEHVESIFLPLVMQRFLSASVMRNAEVPGLVAAQAQEAEVLLRGMRPQAEKMFRFYPGL
ncbi:hypothetical protein EI77_04703 [Prosthecobacter fusiformis]|uniref:Uncharacterized protein n=2 Tax=Prosthecobacter fusiformis TaxID=48464 RepID=A0A4R7RJB8_9BACT|nr:hypothetical protein EI77_04703 [Prosthecobacter fusiformis]